MVISVAQAQSFFLALTRILAMLVQVPVLGGRAIPNPVKVGLGVLLAAILPSWQPLPPETPSLPLFPMLVAVGRELIVGTLAGYAAALTFGVLQMAGELMGLSGGFGAGRVINPTLDISGSALDQFFMIMVVLLFLVTDGHHLFLKGVQRTFTLLPLNGPLPGAWTGSPVESAEGVVALTAQLIAVGVMLALPVGGASLLADLALGLLARVAPQVHVFFLGAPVKVGLSLLALAAALGVVLPTVNDLLRGVGPRMLALLGA